MNKQLKPGDKVYFANEKLPMDVMAISDRYAVCVRPLDIESDFEILAYKVEMGRYYDSKDAYKSLKDEPIYSLLDFKEQKKAPSNLIFNPYDYWSKEGCMQCLNDLDSGQHKLSKRHGIELIIDWGRTLTQQGTALKP